MSLILRLSIPAFILAILFPFRHFLTRSSIAAPRTMSSQAANIPTSPAEWREALDALPSSPRKIPSFFFAHGSPMLASAENAARRGGMEAAMQHQGPKGPLASFLKDFGPALLKKYNPRAIVVFSAHWETLGQRLGE
jgi:hypothetical protein